MDKTSIQVSKLSFRWPNSTNDLINISELSIQQGEKIFIHGASGSGKSTLLNLLTGALSPNNGKISILNQQVDRIKKSHYDAFRADHFGIIFQQFNLIPYLTVFENVMLPLSFSKYRLSKIRESKLNINDQIFSLLNALGLEHQSITNRNVTELSTGQQQRVAAARALIGSPEIIIADEPTSALDADAKHNFIELLFNQTNKASSTLIFVSHDHTLGDMFDRTLSMKSFI
ncbi:MAG: ABC transporter ATP-binding protein [Gammaproteobacteria bacterium]|nr:ABC transporter ATP-binding protein [Gammaproteobacteria bacterium]